jgi:glutathione S-transferase
MAPSQIRLYSAHLCPYALRTRIVLQEKKLAYEHVEIDLKNKPADFLRISPYGKVPMLLDGDARIYESAVINEYLDEKYPSPPLMPKCPEARARVRIWVDFANTRLFPAGYKARLGPPEQRGAGQAELLGHLATLQTELGDKSFIAGDAFSLADIASAPVFARLAKEPDFDWSSFARLEAWWKRIAARPAYVATRGLDPHG